MSPSLRAKIFVAFVLVAGTMGAITVLAVRALNAQGQAGVETVLRQGQEVAALAMLGALPVETQGLVRSHLRAVTRAEKAALAARLLAADTREALALSTLAHLARGTEAALVADLALQAGQAADLRARLLAISDRNALGEATALATRAMPGLRAEITEALRNVAAQAGGSVAAAQAEAALNAIAAAQKNALLNPEPAYVTGQLSAAAMARDELAVAVAVLDRSPAPGLAPLHRDLRDLQALDNRLEALLRDGGADTAATLLEDRLGPLDQRRSAAVDGLAALVQTGMRAADVSAGEEVTRMQTLLILLADVGLLGGFGVVILGLGRIERGLEGAVRLAERMAEGEAAQPAWVRGNLTGRLTAALVRISTGQSAVLASLEALAAGRAPRPDLPERMRARFADLAPRVWPPRGLDGAALRVALQAAQDDGALLQDGLARLAEGLRDVAPLGEELERHHLIAARQGASLIEAGAQLEALAPAVSPRLQRVA